LVYEILTRENNDQISYFTSLKEDQFYFDPINVPTALGKCEDICKKRRIDEICNENRRCKLSVDEYLKSPIREYEGFIFDNPMKPTKKKYQPNDYDVYFYELMNKLKFAGVVSCAKYTKGIYTPIDYTNTCELQVKDDLTETIILESIDENQTLEKLVNLAGLREMEDSDVSDVGPSSIESEIEYEYDPEVEEAKRIFADTWEKVDQVEQRGGDLEKFYLEQQKYDSQSEDQKSYEKVEEIDEWKELDNIFDKISS